MALIAFTNIARDAASIKLQFWRCAWQSFLRHPLFGIGTDGFCGVWGPYTTRIGHPDWAGYAHAHNLYLNVLCEQGLAGAVVLVAAILFLVVRLRRARPLLFTPDQGIVTATMLILLAQGVHNLVDMVWLRDDFLVPMAAVCGLLLGAARRPEANITGQQQLCRLVRGEIWQRH